MRIRAPLFLRILQTGRMMINAAPVCLLHKPIYYGDADKMAGMNLLNPSLGQDRVFIINKI